MSDSRVLPKRAACDRCRTQKLRCIRLPNHPSDSCSRCVRSQMECVSSSSKRPGRPRNSTNTSLRSSESSTSPSTSSAVGVDATVPAVDLQMLGDLDWFNLDFLDPGYNITSEPWTMMDSIFPGDSIDIVENTLLQMQNQSCTDVSGQNIFMETTEGDPLFLQTNLENNTNPQALHNYPATLDLDPSVQLAIFQRELSVQMFALKSMPWDVAKALRITSMPGSGSSTPEPDDEYNPLAKIAKTTEDFANFLRSFQESLSKKGGDSSPESRMSLLQSSLSVADLLTVLSCHMLALSIYETIFSHFIDQALQNPSLVNDLLQSTPQLFVGGIAVPPRLDMLGHLLYCLAVSLLQPIEMLLGLPDDFCVSLQRDRHGYGKECGLFSGQSGQLLFTTLLTLEEERMKEGGGGPGVIASLKEKIRRVQGLHVT